MPRLDRTSPLIAYVAPFAAFMLFLGLDSVISSFGKESGIWWLATPKYWIFPLQTVVCAALLLVFHKHYSFGSFRPWFWGVLWGIIALLVWISPQVIFRMAYRTDGFNPEAFGTDSGIYWMMVIARFARLVIIVPLLEEIFWRGFLMRYLIKENFEKVPFGTFTPLSFFGVAGLFMLGHSMADRPAAILTGVIFGYVAIKTKSLWACVIAHAVTNAGLGAYIMATRQWGFW
jgi:CAAX prenyl protease-like protein